MGRLILECPRTRRAIDAGIQMDEATFNAANPATVKLSCPYCSATHELRVQCGHLSEACDPEVFVEPEPPRPPALTIAVNALRIRWLQRGLAFRTHHSPD